MHRGAVRVNGGVGRSNPLAPWAGCRRPRVMPWGPRLQKRAARHEPLSWALAMCTPSPRRRAAWSSVGGADTLPWKRASTASSSPPSRVPHERAAHDPAHDAQPLASPAHPPLGPHFRKALMRRSRRGSAGEGTGGDHVQAGGERRANGYLETKVE
jgi:hypothetical protein